MTISDTDDGLPQPTFVEEIAELLLNEPARKAITEYNFELGQKLISMDRFKSHLFALFPDTFNTITTKGVDAYVG
ncbi:MAG: hypothetical protein GDA44_03980 [Prochloron sp. SP5CPC1]|nr:hypothetical protein [Candidatus Paraprochloron terpiosi SP5CPC1]